MSPRHGLLRQPVRTGVSPYVAPGRAQHLRGGVRLGAGGSAGEEPGWQQLRANVTMVALTDESAGFQPPESESAAGGSGVIEGTTPVT